jgi:hypothetical protein
VTSVALRSWSLSVVLLLSAESALAHEGDHSCMLHMVSVGIVPLHVATFDSEHPAFDEAGTSIGAVGVSLAYALAATRMLELRIRAEYLKPFPEAEPLSDGLHRFRGVFAPAIVVPLIPDRLDLAGGFDAGVVVYGLDEKSGFEEVFAVGWTASAAIELRGWVTWHTGFGVALRAGFDDATTDANFPLRSAWPFELALTYSDRF